MQCEIFTELHETQTAGHFGSKKTLDCIRDHFYWPNCRRGLYCWKGKKGPLYKKRAPMINYNVGASMKTIALDVLGPLPESIKGNKYLLIDMDMKKTRTTHFVPSQMGWLNVSTELSKLSWQYLSIQCFGTKPS